MYPPQLSKFGISRNVAVTAPHAALPETLPE